MCLLPKTPLAMLRAQLGDMGKRRRKRRKKGSWSLFWWRLAWKQGWQ
jgi:hypothetical protein